MRSFFVEAAENYFVLGDRTLFVYGRIFLWTPRLSPLSFYHSKFFC